MTRHEALLRKTAEALENGADPFSDYFLSENNVSLGECIDLANTVSVLIKGYLNSPKTTRQIIMFAGVADGTLLGVPDSIAYIKAQLEADEAIAQLRKLED